MSPYLNPPAVLDAVSAFLESDRRVFVLSGPPGVGKSRAVERLTLDSGGAVVQLHDVRSWRLQDVMLAAEVLRYASLEPGPDPLLTLEHVLAGVVHPLLVAIDGIATASHLHTVARQVDGLLRQVTGRQLRFMLVVRTPPEVELSRYPVLAASTFVRASPRSADGGHVSFRLNAWSSAQARQAWNMARAEGAPDFDRLPLSVRRLMRLPLYQRLALSLSASFQVPTSGGYALVDACIRSLARLDGGEVDSVIDDVAHHASAAAEELPDRFRKPSPSPRDGTTDEFGRLARVAPDGAMVFEHDVVREYFLATRVSDVLIELETSLAMSAALDELAHVAQVSAVVRGVMDFAVQRLDGLATVVLSDAVASSLIDAAVTAPLMVEFAGLDATWLTTDVARSLMFRCISEASLPLAQSLLGST